MVIVCVAVIGAQNQPLFLETYGAHIGEEQSFHYIVHCALDAVEEKAKRA